MVTIHVAGFQTVTIFMQTGDMAKSMTAADTMSDMVKNSPNKVRMESNIIKLIYYFYL